MCMYILWMVGVGERATALLYARALLYVGPWLQREHMPGTPPTWAATLLRGTAEISWRCRRRVRTRLVGACNTRAAAGGPARV